LSPEPCSQVTVLAVGDHKVITTFPVDSLTDRVILSPDGSRLVVLLRHGKGGFKFFDVEKKCSIQRTDPEDLNWLPHLNGVLLSWNSGSLLGRFIDHSEGPFPVLRIPGDVQVNILTVGTSMFALGTKDGQILIGRAPTSSIH